MTCEPLTCLPAPEAGSSEISSLAINPSSPSSGTPTPAPSCADNSQGCASSKAMCDPWTSRASWLESMRCALDSLARTYQPQARASAYRAKSLASIARSCVQLTLFDLPGCFSKTAHASEPRDATSSLGTLWREDIPGATESLERLTSAPRTSATDGGSLGGVPTPTVMDSEMAGGKGCIQRGARGLSLHRWGQVWPTPAATDHKTPYRGEALAAQQAKRSKPLRDAISAPAGGKLNPEWVEWLMGWPLMHTAIGPDASARSATGRSRSARRSRGDCSEVPSP
jgi:hypothetical protein